MNLNKIKNKHKGRGNSWLKLPKNHIALDLAFKKLSTIDDKNLFNFFEKEGFGWARFSKITKENKVRYEIRWRGCKLDHKDFFVDYNFEDVIDLPLLGNTPLKLNSSAFSWSTSIMRYRSHILYRSDYIANRL